MRLAALGILLAATVSVAAEEPKVDPTEIFRRTIERARELAKDASGPVYLYDKRTTIESLDPDGNVTDSKAQLFEVTVAGGVPDARLIKIEGRSLTSEQIAREDDEIRRRRRVFLSHEADGEKPKRQSFVPEDLARRFDLSWERTELVAGRPTHVIAFTPREPAPAEKTFADRVANRLSGTIWIDAEDAEIARLEVALLERVKLWGGVIGLLDDFTYSLGRKRGEGGVWHNDLAEIGLDARGFLVKRLRFRVIEQSSRFRKAPATAPALPPAPAPLVSVQSPISSD